MVVLLVHVYRTRQLGVSKHAQGIAVEREENWGEKSCHRDFNSVCVYKHYIMINSNVRKIHEDT